MSTPLPTLPPHPGQVVPRATRAAEALRVVLVLLLLLNGARGATRPDERSPDELVTALEAGRVTTLTIERPAGPAAGDFRAEWASDDGDAWTSYPVDSSAPGGGTDEGRRILAAADRSPTPVDVRQVDELLPRSDPAWLVALAVSVMVLLVVLLTGGTYPRLATRWAWFWLMWSAWPFAVAFLVLEPTPLGSRGDVVRPARRLTGGWAYLLSLLIGPVVLAAVGS